MENHTTKLLAWSIILSLSSFFGLLLHQTGDMVIVFILALIFLIIMIIVTELEKPRKRRSR